MTASVLGVTLDRPKAGRCRPPPVGIKPQSHICLRAASRTLPIFDRECAAPPGLAGRSLAELGSFAPSKPTQVGLELRGSAPAKRGL